MEASINDKHAIITTNKQTNKQTTAATPPTTKKIGLLLVRVAGSIYLTRPSERLAGHASTQLCYLSNAGTHSQRKSDTPSHKP
eukprot:1141656-Pelagomonas_calceolata.AAC.4